MSNSVEIWTRYFAAPVTAVQEKVGLAETVEPSVGLRRVGAPDGATAPTAAGKSPASITSAAATEKMRARDERLEALGTMRVPPRDASGRIDPGQK